MLNSLKQDLHIAERPDRFNFDKVNWNLFQTLTEIDNDPENYANIDDTLNILEDHITEAAKGSIPVKRGIAHRIPLPWWNEQCTMAIRERTLAERAMKRSPTIENESRYKTCKSRCHFVLNKSRKESW